jgi:hypothetical protein
MAGRPCREPPLHTSNTVVLLLVRCGAENDRE